MFPFGPELRAALVAMVRKRVPERDIEDIVQAALTEAIQSPHAPSDRESLRRWIFGIAKNKVVDYHRRAGRESYALPEIAAEPAPHVEADLLRWAARHLPDGEENAKTLDWMLREGDGEKLESIAAAEQVPPPRVRQRISRLRRHFRKHWQREVLLLAALGVAVSAVFFFLLREPEPIARDNGDPRAEPIRRGALEKCDAGAWDECIAGLDAAKKLDPAGDARPEVKRARQTAEDARTPEATPPPSPSTTPVQPPAPSALPTTSEVPRPMPTTTLAVPPPMPLDRAESTSSFTQTPQSPSKPSSKALPFKPLPLSPPKAIDTSVSKPEVDSKVAPRPIGKKK